MSNVRYRTNLTKSWQRSRSKFDNFDIRCLDYQILRVLVWSDAKVRKTCDPRKILQQYCFFFAKIGFGTADNETSKVLSYKDLTSHNYIVTSA